MGTPDLDRYLNEFAKKMFVGKDTDEYCPLNSIRHALATRQISVDYVVDQLRIGLKEALGRWIVEAWEKELKGKKVFKVEEHRRFYYYDVIRVNITFDDGTVLQIADHGSHGLETKIFKEDPPKEKVFPWKQNEIKFIAKLSQEEKERYQVARDAFFWLIENREKVVKHYEFFDKSRQEMRKSFSISIDKEKDDPKGILTIFFSSHVAPECDDWFELGLKRDWKRIIEMKDEVEKGT